MRALLLASLVFGILSLIAFVPGALVIGAFLFVIPMLVLAIAPNAFALCVAALIGRWLAGPDRPLRRPVFWLPVVLLVACSAAIAAYFNHDLGQQVRRLQQDDVDLHASLSGFHQLALRVVGGTQHRAAIAADAPPHGGKRHHRYDPADPAYFTQAGICDNTCLDLLYGGIVTSVLVASVSPDDAGRAPAPDEPATRFHVEHLANCPPVMFQIGPQSMTLSWARAHQIRHMSFVAPALRRMVDGDCLVPEPATLGDADAVVQVNDLVLPPGNESNRPSARNLLQLRTAPLSARRTSIYSAANGSSTEVFRRTAVRSYPLLPVLACLPTATGEGGIGITEGFVRRERIDRAYELRDVLKTALGVDLPNLTTRPETGSVALQDRIERTEQGRHLLAGGGVDEGQP